MSTYAEILEMMGDFLEEQGSKPAADWTRYKEDRRRDALAWAEVEAIRVLPEADLVKLKKTKTGIVAATATTIAASALGDDVLRILDMYAYFTAGAYNVHFKELIGQEIALRDNVNFAAGHFFYRSDDGGLVLVVPSYAVLASYDATVEADKPAIIYVRYPDSWRGNWEEGTLTFDPPPTAPNLFAVDEVVTGAGGATGVVTSIANQVSGVISVEKVTGTFVNGEAVTGSVVGSGTLAASDGFDIDDVTCLLEGHERNLAKSAAERILQQEKILAG